MATITKDKLLTPEEAADLLGITAGTLNVWRCTRRYPLAWVRVGRAIRYELAEIERFIESRRVRPVEL